MALFSYSVCRKVGRLLPESRHCFVCRTLTSTHYEVLGLEMNASKDQIRNSYLELTKKHHPDVNANSQSSHEKFKKIALAYSVLSDPSKRRKYDGEILDSMGYENNFKQDVNRPYTQTSRNFYGQADLRRKYYNENNAENDTSSISTRSGLHWMITRIGTCSVIFLLLCIAFRIELKKQNKELHKNYLNQRREHYRLFMQDYKRNANSESDILKATGGVK